MTGVVKNPPVNAGDINCLKTKQIFEIRFKTKTKTCQYNDLQRVPMNVDAARHGKSLQMILPGISTSHLWPKGGPEHWAPM